MLGEDGTITEAFVKERPEATNLIAIYAALGREDLRSVLADVAGKSFSDFKAMLTERAVDQLAPIGAEMQRLLDDPAYVDGVLRDGAARPAIAIRWSSRSTTSSACSAPEPNRNRILKP